MTPTSLRAESAYIQTIRCAWCNADLGTKPGATAGETTSMCQGCLDTLYPDEGDGKAAWEGR